MNERRTFTPEFKREAVRLSYDSGRTVEEISDDLGIGKSTLTTWRRTFRDASEDERMVDPNEDELVRLRREIKTLRQERDILKKATAFSHGREVNDFQIHCSGETTFPCPYVMSFAWWK